ncbi:MAG: fused MFS/spermidine synthase [Deltaproteobacteria bacterium]|nr:fused MFS/spermidine synthase [Deltaproteobacteria bacterium]
MAFLYSATLFVSAFLLFSVQPLAGKILLPLLGGSPDVWNTCMLFFQALLLLGYLYAHALSRYVPRRAQGPLHLAIAAGTCACIIGKGALGPDASTLAGSWPVGWILRTLTLWLGAPVFLLASTSPLLQLWYSRSGKSGTRDPYFLYSASNLGSLIALLGFPLLIEPAFSLSRARWLWNAGFFLLAGTLALIALTPHARAGKPLPPTRRIPTLQLARWVWLAFIPSSLLLGVTTYLSTDIAPVPLLWVIPLALYLLSFIVATRGIKPASLQALGRVLALTALFTIIALSRYFDYPGLLLILLHLTLFTVAATLCHGLLMSSRPPAGRLTEFYLCVALGGALGGIFNSLVAPVVFQTLAEYPMAILIAVFLRPMRVEKAFKARALWVDVAYALGIGICVTVLPALALRLTWLPQHLHNTLVIGLPAVLTLRAIGNRNRFTLALLALNVCTTLLPANEQNILTRQRGFFGSLLVFDDTDRKAVMLFHGRTLHGVQSRRPELQAEPLSYYSKTGPIGEVLQRSPWRRDVAVVGLGTGSLAAYARPKENWTFYEINPQISAIARNADYFTFLRDSPGADKVAIELGDARLRLSARADATLDLLIVDAFGSDSIPVHLITREALELYWRKLRPSGWLAFHISNKYLDLTRALGPLAAATGAQALTRNDHRKDVEGLARSSKWLLMARSPESLKPFAADPNWKHIEAAGDSGHVWSDDYFNLLALLRFW